MYNDGVKLVIQRVAKASVKDLETDKILGEINEGLLVLVGVKEGDTKKEAEKLAKKLANIRLMKDENNKMNKSVNDVGGKFLVISQFTLYADTAKGNRPSFIKAAKPQLANDLYGYFIKVLRSEGTVETGEFGAYMEIKARLDGPVTILIEDN